MPALALVWDLIANDAASPTFNKVAASADRAAASTDRASASATGFGKKAVAALGALATIDFAVHAVKDAAAFQAAMLKVQTQAGASASQVKTFSSAILSLAGPTATAPEKLATSLYHIVSASQGILSTRQELQELKIAAEGAKVGGADLEETTNALTSAVVSGIPGVKNMSEAMGSLNAIVGVGDMSLQDLNDALGTGILKVAKGFGLSLADVGAALADFGDNNIRGAAAASDLRQALMGMAVPIKTGQAELENLGLSSTQLGKDMQTGGLMKALGDLKSHLDSAGITGSKVSQELTEVFGKKVGVGLDILVDDFDRLQIKEDEIKKGATGFGTAWKATQGTASFALSSISAEFQAAAISAGDKLLPAVTEIAKWLGQELPPLAHAVAQAFEPLEEALKEIASAAGDVFGPLASALGAIKGPLTDVAAVALGMWAAFKGYQIAVAAGNAVRGALAGIQASTTGAFAAMRGYGQGVTGVLTGTASASSRAALQLQADLAAVGRDAAIEAAAIDAALADEAEAYASLVAASDSATATLIANSQNAATAAQEQAAASAAAAAEMAESAASASAAVDAAGESATVGWAGVAGPIGAAAVGIGLVVSMFHESSQSSQEATASAKAFADAIKQATSGTGSGDVTSAMNTSVLDQINQADIPSKLTKINGSLQGTTITAAEFSQAIEGNGSAAKSVYSALASYGKQGISQAEYASKLAAQLSAVSKAYSQSGEAAAQQAIQESKSSATMSTAAQAAKLSTDTAQKYAAMLGTVADNGTVTGLSQSALNAQIDKIATAYNTATQTGSAFLDSLQTFSGSAGTASDRAALIGATLKANAGDALSFASAMNGAVSAVASFGSDVASNAKQAGDSTDKYLKNLVNLKTGTLDYNKAAAAPLISDLQQIQTNAINAAEATYQHNIQTLGAKKAADTAVSGYEGVESSLEGQLTKLGLTKGAAQKLTEQYLGVPKNVKTLIEQEGANPVLDVLNSIGKQLSYLTGHPWKPSVAVADKASSAIESIKTRLDSLHDKTVTIKTATTTITEHITKNSVIGSSSNGPVKFSATGGSIFGPGTSTSDSIPAMLSNGEFVVNAAQASKFRPLLESINKGTQGFATGGSVSGASINLAGTSSSFQSGFNSVYKQLARDRAPRSLLSTLSREDSALSSEINARNSLASKLKSVDSAMASLKSTVSQSVGSFFDVTQAGANAVTGSVTGSDLQAQQSQALVKIKQWAAGIKTLGSRHLNSAYLAQLASAGPSTLPQVQALLSLKSLASINSTESAIASYGATAGNIAANAAYGAQQKSLAAQEKAADARVAKLEKSLASTLKTALHDVSHAPVVVKYNGKTLLEIVQTEEKKAKRR